MQNLPSNWVTCSLQEILQSLESGTRPRGGVRGIKSGIPSIGGEHLTSRGAFNFESIKYVPKEFAKKMSKGQIKEGDILIVKDGATTGKVAFVDSQFPFPAAVVNEHVFICRPAKDVNPKYLYYYLLSNEGQSRILDNFKGSAQGGINKTFIENCDLPLAPFKEEERIVNKIENFSLRFENCRNRLEKVSTLIKKLYESVILFAYSGELTSNWRQKNGLPSWDEFLLSDLILEKPRNGYSPRAVNYLTNVKSLTLTATTSGFFREDCFKYIDEEIPRDSYLWLKKGDILIQRSNSLDYVGVSAIYTGEDNQCIYPDLMMRVRPNQKVLSEFLWIALSSSKVRSYFRENATGTAGNMPKINQPTVMNAPIFCPTIEEQKQVICKVKILFKAIGEIESRYREAEKFINKLGQSVLISAFAGKLVEPDLSAESAEILLARIKRSKETTELSVKPNRKFWFDLKLGIGAVLENLAKTPYPRGEMVIAKMMFFLQEVYRVPFGLRFVPQQFGPYDANIKKAILGSAFGKDKFFQVNGRGDTQVYGLGVNANQLFKYNSHTLTQSRAALKDLMGRIGQMKSVEIELLASVCKVIQDYQVSETNDIFNKLAEWKPGRFTINEVNGAVQKIKSWKWDTKLLQV